MNFRHDFKKLAERRRFETPELNPVETPPITNPVCGDEVSVSVELRSERVTAVAYKARGCWPVFGCLELLGDRVLHRTVQECLAYTLEEFLAEVEGVPAGKRHAFSLAHQAVRRAVVQAATRALNSSADPVGPGSKERV